MKKLIILLLFCPLFMFGQDTIPEGPDVIVMDTSEISAFLDSLGVSASRVDDWKSLLKELPNLTGYTVQVKDGIAVAVKKLPPPTSIEGVSAWTDFITSYWERISAVLLFLLTAGFRVLKRDPKVLKTVAGKVMAFTRTRGFIVIVGAGLSIAGLVFFNEGDWTFSKAASYFFTSVFGGIGIREVLDWLIDLWNKVKNIGKSVPA